MHKKFQPLSVWLNLLSHTGIFSLLDKSLQYFASSINWPDINNFNHFLQSLPQPLKNQRGQEIYCVEQHAKCDSLENNYEYQIYHKNNLPMRKENWHDFFNLLVWSVFPLTKAQLNAWQVEDMERHYPQWKVRSNRQNKLAQFDESGIVILSNEAALLDLIKAHRWHELFFMNRNKLSQKLRPIIFGHALYEKNLQPYIGLTGKAILISTESEPWDIPESLIDPFILSHLYEDYQLYPFPLLGYPKWYSDNENESFYFNKNYFRD